MELFFELCKLYYVPNCMLGIWRFTRQITKSLSLETNFKPARALPLGPNKRHYTGSVSKWLL